MEWPARPQRVRELLEEMYLPLYRYAYRLTGSSADAEDLTQETICKAQMRLHQLRDAGALRSWLFAILRNEYLRGRRDAAALKVVSLDAIGDYPEATAEIEGPIDPAALQAALAELPEIYRTPLILYYFEEFSYREMADQMEVPVGTVMSRLSRAKAFLRHRLAPAADFPKPAPEARVHGL